MLTKIPHSKMGTNHLDWLKSYFHFSFAEYYNPENMQFGVLRVLNDDEVQAGQGFPMHSHRDMEIVSYVIQGELSHGDGMGNKSTLKRGHFQYMSAGSGVTHSEYNTGTTLLRLLQLWILPDAKDYPPSYSDLTLDLDHRENNWFHAVSGQNGDGKIKIHQDANIYIAELDKGKEITFPVQKGRQVYLVLIEGNAQIKNHTLVERDALTSIEEDIPVHATENAHILLVEMKKA